MHMISDPNAMFIQISYYLFICIYVLHEKSFLSLSPSHMARIERVWQICQGSQVRIQPGLLSHVEFKGTSTSISFPLSVLSFLTLSLSLSPTHLSPTLYLHINTAIIILILDR